MPHKLIEDRRKWDRDYYKKRKEEGSAPDPSLSCEKAIIDAVSAQPAQLDCPSLYWALNQKWSYKQVQSTVKVLLGDGGNDGVLEYDRDIMFDQRRKVLVLRNVPVATLAPSPVPVVTAEAQQ